MADMDNVIKCMAKQLRDGDTVYTGLASVPAVLAVALAKHWGLNIWFINVAEIYEPRDILITPSSGDPYLFIDGEGFVTSLDAFDLARRGQLDVMFFSAAQVDRRGNMNLSVIGGSYERPRVRLPGGAAAAYLYRRARRIVMWLKEHSRRTLVERVDFITAPGPTRQGPRLTICTPKAMFEFDHELGELVLTGVFPGVTVDEVINNMAFKPRVRETLSILEAATQDELQFLNKLDPGGVRYS
ncbi:CoA-transferase [Vulcanisaeta sp. JCM 16161]|uniref:CoA-transferase subunit beta n=1 Tax=Vulcanisaeta sp. JCM 16161 TaxID=1295372 RepID=UPI0006D247AD|nr:CoA-transferase [Vulcanisaeta sp. JCM 16161]